MTIARHKKRAITMPDTFANTLKYIGKKAYLGLDGQRTCNYRPSIRPEVELYAQLLRLEGSNFTVLLGLSGFHI